jgi:hypothetical protein
MGSRQGNDSKGSFFNADTNNASAMAQRDVNYSGGPTANPALRTLVGLTIRGLVVGPLEHWADGTVWDTGNNRALVPGSDFDTALLNRSGF